MLFLELFAQRLGFFIARQHVMPAEGDVVTAHSVRLSARLSNAATES